MKQNTLLAQAGSHWDKQTGAVSMPLYASAIYRHPKLGQSTGFDYSRTANPTRSVLQDILAQLESGAGAAAFASGLAAIDAVLHLFKPGDHLLVTEDLYGGTIRLLDQIYAQYGLKITYVDTSDADKVASAFAQHQFQGVFIEIPTNPLLKVADLHQIVALSKKQNALVIVDNTFLTPVLCKPLDLGADIVVHSATKYLSGHNDLIGGAVISKDPKIAERIIYFQNSIGAILSPNDCWMLIRSLKTLAVRLKRQEENALAVAQFLTTQKRVTKVFYPGLPDNPGHDLLKKQSSGFGAMISIEVDEPDLVPRILEEIKVFFFAESLGGTESLITFPAVQTHFDIPEEERNRLGITNRLLRISIGLEDAEDLIADLKHVLR